MFRLIADKEELATFKTIPEALSYAYNQDKPDWTMYDDGIDWNIQKVETEKPKGTTGWIPPQTVNPELYSEQPENPYIAHGGKGASWSKRLDDMERMLEIEGKVKKDYPTGMKGWEWEIVAGGMVHTLHRDDMTYEEFIMFHHAHITDPCHPHGRLSEEQFKELWVEDDFLQPEVWDEPLEELEETPEDIPDEEEEDIPDAEVHYRAGHWIAGDIVETVKEMVTKIHKLIHISKQVFLSRTRLQTRRAGYLTPKQWDNLFGDIPEAVRKATSGIHPLAPLLGMERVSARFIDGLKAAGYTVEKIIPKGYKRQVTCLIIP